MRMISSESSFCVYVCVCLPVFVCMCVCVNSINSISKLLLPSRL